MTSKQFMKLSRNKRRVLIAEDILLQIKLKTFVMEDGEYCRITNLNDNISPKNLSIKIKNKSLTCEVCARGALLMSTVGFKNELALDDITNTWNFEYENNAICTNYINSEFSELEQAIMETIFEGAPFGMVDKIFEISLICKKYRISLMKFSNKQVTTYVDYAMKRICKNIIDSKGKYILPEKLMIQINSEVEEYAYMF